MNTTTQCVFRKCYSLPQLNTVGGAQPVFGVSPPDNGGSAAVVGARRRSTETTAGFEERDRESPRPDQSLINGL